MIKQPCWAYEGRFCPAANGCHYPMHCDGPQEMTRHVVYGPTPNGGPANPPGSVFLCGRCRQLKPCHVGTGGTGYAVRDDGTLLCYACCGQTDRLYMLDHDQITLYLVKRGEDWWATNWPDTLSFRASVSEFRHPFSRSARQAYFTVNRQSWRGVNIGDSQILHCRKLKRKVRR